ncbi:MAG: thioesterase family protein [Dokdonella sp.]|uniref:acyl-CoA thioesterase n=1 Tax=Dokdonella sp. TaxID=2291710 RepID=UPI003264573F
MNAPSNADGHGDRPSAPKAAESATAIIRVPLSVRWGDLDAFNHVNNAAFLDYVQEARLHWMTSLDGAWLDDAQMPVVAAAHVNFRQQLTWPANIVVELRIERVGRSSVTIAHRITASSDATRLYADGDTVLVWIDRKSGQSIALPAAIRAACQSPLASAGTTSK